MIRYKLTIQYDGEQYHGWQRQPNAVTVQAVIESAIERVSGHPVTVEGSGRTDEGVHALGQVAHFDTDKELDCDRYLAAINYYLPNDIRITKCERAENNFHARKSAKRKTYMYLMYGNDVSVTCDSEVSVCDEVSVTCDSEVSVENPLLRNRAYFVGNVDVEKMNNEAKSLVGTHDFSAVMSSGSSAKTFTRTVYSAEVQRQNGFIVFKITGSGFLYNMVRILAAALVRLGKGNGRAIGEIISGRDRKLAPQIAPPFGLYLLSVEY